jgi:hypothetical protein
VPERGLDPEVHLPLVRNDSIVLVQRRFSDALDRRPIVGQRLGGELEGSGPRGDGNTEIPMAEGDRDISSEGVDDVDCG